MQKFEDAECIFLAKKVGFPFYFRNFAPLSRGRTPLDKRYDVSEVQLKCEIK